MMRSLNLWLLTALVVVASLSPSAARQVSQTGRVVHNRSAARFRFRDGRIVEHVDTFDLWKWASMALGAKGTLLGWLPAVQGKIRAQADKGLRQFMAGSRG